MFYIETLIAFNHFANQLKSHNVWLMTRSHPVSASKTHQVVIAPITTAMCAILAKYLHFAKNFEFNCCLFVLKFKYKELFIVTDVTDDVIFFLLDHSRLENDDTLIWECGNFLATKLTVRVKKKNVKKWRQIALLMFLFFVWSKNRTCFSFLLIDMCL